MGFTKKQLKEIYKKNKGYCVFCKKKIYITNYGKKCKKGAWEVDHGNPLSRGGVDAKRNWQPACYPCNKEKGDKTSYGFRRSIGKRITSVSFRREMKREHCGR